MLAIAAKGTKCQTVPSLRKARAVWATKSAGWAAVTKASRGDSSYPGPARLDLRKVTRISISQPHHEEVTITLSAP